jgi:hypothetical protein
VAGSTGADALNAVPVDRSAAERIKTRGGCFDIVTCLPFIDTCFPVRAFSEQAFLSSYSRMADVTRWKGFALLIVLSLHLEDVYRLFRQGMSLIQFAWRSFFFVE